MIVKTLFEIAMVILVLWMIKNEDRLIQFEHRVKRRFIRHIIRQCKKFQNTEEKKNG